MQLMTKNNKHPGIIFGSSFAYMLIGPIIFLIPLFILLKAYDSNFAFSLSYFQSKEFFFASLVADAASKLILISFFVVYLFSELKKNYLDFLKNIPKYILYIIVGVVLMIVILIILNYIYRILGIEGESNNQAILIEATNSSIRPIMLFSIVFAAPFVEEIIFRKLLFDFIEKTLKLSIWWAFGISTFVFAAIHVISDINSYVFIFQYLVLAAVISLSYVLSKKNIIVPMGIHFINNLISFLEIII